MKTWFIAGCIWFQVCVFSLCSHFASFAHFNVGILYIFMLFLFLMIHHCFPYSLLVSVLRRFFAVFLPIVLGVFVACSLLVCFCLLLLGCACLWYVLVCFVICLMYLASSLYVFPCFSSGLCLPLPCFSVRVLSRCLLSYPPVCLDRIKSSTQKIEV